MDSQKDKEAQLDSFCSQYQERNVKIGSIVKTEVQLIKDYGIITKLDNETGFIMND